MVCGGGGVAATREAVRRDASVGASVVMSVASWRSSLHFLNSSSSLSFLVMSQSVNLSVSVHHIHSKLSRTGHKRKKLTVFSFK